MIHVIARDAQDKKELWDSLDRLGLGDACSMALNQFGQLGAQEVTRLMTALHIDGHVVGRVMEHQFQT